MTGPSYTPAEMLATLVAFDTVSARSNLELIAFVADYLDQHGVASILVHNEDKTKADLFATVGPKEPNGVALSGHSDVVPVAGQEWVSDPFTLLRRDGRFFGRGTSDMKGFIAAVLSAVPAFVRAKPRRPIHIVLSYDEEVGCLGIRPLLAKLGRELPKPAIAIIGEPTDMRIVTAHKGVYGFETMVGGVAAHSSAPDLGVNAIAFGADIIAQLGATASKWRQDGPRDDRFDPPFTSLNIGLIEGGNALNIIPAHCAIRWEFRPIPAADPNRLRDEIELHFAESILPRLRAEHPDTTLTTRSLAAVPGMNSPDDAPAARLVSRLTGANRSYAVSYAAEAGLFQREDISTVICGPGSIAQAHQPDEWLSEEQLALCTAFLQRLAEWAADPD